MTKEQSDFLDKWIDNFLTQINAKPKGLFTPIHWSNAKKELLKEIKKWAT